MALHITDPETEEAVRDLARLRNTSLTEAVKTACRNELRQERRKLPVEERLAAIHARIRAMPNSGVKLDKKFYDDLWGEDDLRGDES